MVIMAGVCEGEAATEEITHKHGEDHVRFMRMDVNDPRDLEGKS